MKLRFMNIILCNVGFLVLFFLFNLLTDDFLKALVFTEIPFILLTWKVPVVEWDD